ncbi:hypothetical protein HYQ46_012381 [Verticillium longisporum]|nr:hypothetical protein HYQ46_012381 [Verticillium longisporum]
MVQESVTAFRAGCFMLLVPSFLASNLAGRCCRRILLVTARGTASRAALLRRWPNVATPAHLPRTASGLP